MANGTFYVARLHKGGRLTDELVVRALAHPTPIVRGDHAWTFTDVVSNPDGPWYYGKLTKYKPEGVVSVIDHSKNAEVHQLEPDLVVASSPFVYLPKHSAVAYLHIWNLIERQVFPRRFSELVEETLQRFFVHCSLEPVANLRSFLRKLADLERITHLSAKVHPPNPLFGRLWAGLNDYVKQRNAEFVRITEQASDGALTSTLPKIASAVANSEPDQLQLPKEPLPIGDAAILMAADGYGTGRITGKSRTTTVTIRTVETQFNFDIDRDTDPDALAEHTANLLKRMEDERGLTHGGRKTNR